MKNESLTSFAEKMIPTVLELGKFSVDSQAGVENIGKKSTDSLDSDSDFVRQVKEAKTVIDEQVQEGLLKSAHEFLKGTSVKIDAEEDTPSLTLFSREETGVTLVIDPIDGTLEYVNGQDGFSICLGLISDGEIVSALVYFPVHKKLYLLGSDQRSYVCDVQDLEIVSKVPISAPEKTDHQRAWANNRISSELDTQLTQKYTLTRGDSGWAFPLLDCMAGEYESVAFGGVQIRDVLLGAMIEKAIGGYATDFSGNPLKWPAGGRIPESIFGFGTPLNMKIVQSST